MTQDNAMVPRETFNELETKVHLWAKEKGIHNKSNTEHQFQKFLEEVDELAAEIELHKHSLNLGRSPNLAHIKSELGDVLVTLINTCHFLETDLTECLEVAYNKISKRKGQMLNGKFVKE